jgi:hypothetical protein
MAKWQNRLAVRGVNAVLLLPWRGKSTVSKRAACRTWRVGADNGRRRASEACPNKLLGVYRIVDVVGPNCVRHLTLSRRKTACLASRRRTRAPALCKRVPVDALHPDCGSMNCDADHNVPAQLSAGRLP